MADEINSIVKVDITADSTTVSRLGFGTPLILAYHTVFVERYRIYTNTADMISDGFTTSSHAYRMAKAAFDQDPTVSQVVVGRLPAAPAFVTRATMTSATTGVVVKLKVICPEAGTITDPAVSGGTISPTGAVLAGQVVQITYTIPGASTTTTVATAVEQLVEAVAGVNSTSTGANIDAVPVTAGRRVFMYDNENCNLSETTAAAGYDTELTALELEPDLDWYFIATDSSSTANISAVAAWVLSRKKMYFVASQSSGLLDNTDAAASDLLALGNDRTVIIYSKNAHEFAGVAWATVIGAQTPGSITTAFKDLKGVTVSSFSTTAKTNLENDNVNHFMSVRRKRVTRPGKVTSGEWIDVRHGIDALESRIQEDVFALLADSAKVPFTQKGLDMIGAAIKAACKAFEGNKDQEGLLVEGSVKVIMPALSSISASDKQNRRLTGVRFSAQLAGAIHYIEIAGTLSNVA